MQPCDSERLCINYFSQFRSCLRKPLFGLTIGLHERRCSKALSNVIDLCLIK